MLVSIAHAMAPAQPGAASAGGMDMLMQFVPLILMFVIFWFLLIRPQQKRAKSHREMLGQLKRGDYVVTAGGFMGRILEIDDESILLECGESKLRLTRSSIAGLMDPKTNKATSESSSEK